VRSCASGDTDYVESNGLMEEYAFSFTTGTETLPRLVLDHELTVDFEVVEKDYFPAARTHPCGGGLMGACEPDGKHAAENAIVHVRAAGKRRSCGWGLSRRCRLHDGRAIRTRCASVTPSE
jgi:hypothetical protein